MYIQSYCCEYHVIEIFQVAAYVRMYVATYICMQANNLISLRLSINNEIYQISQLQMKG